MAGPPTGGVPAGRTGGRDDGRSHRRTGRPGAAGDRGAPRLRAPHRERRAGHPRQARRDRDGRGRAPRPGARARGGPARGGQDDPRPRPRPLDPGRLPAGAVHARPAAERRDRRLDLRPEGDEVLLPPGAGLRQRPARRRGEPRDAPHPVGLPRGDGGAAGLGGRGRLPHPQAVLPDRDPEPDRDGGHLPAARGAARPLHDARGDRLPVGRDRGGHAARAARVPPDPRPAAGDGRRAPDADAGRGAARLRARLPAALRAAAREPRRGGTRTRPSARAPAGPSPSCGRRRRSPPSGGRAS